MPSRILREGILTSDRVDKLDAQAEVFYRRLMSVVDDYGRFDARPAVLRVTCYPLRVDVVREADISRWIAICEKAGLIVLYAVNGKQYLELTDFRQSVRAKQSKYPCSADATQALCRCDADAPVVEVEFGDEDERASKPTPAKPHSKPKPSPLPPDFKISGRVSEWARSKGHLRLPEHFENFVGVARAKGYKYVDWDEALMNAVRNNWAKLEDAKTGGFAKSKGAAL